LIFPIMLLLVAGGADLARSFFVGMEVADGAREAALVAADNPYTTYTQAQFTKLIQDTYGGSPLTCPVGDLTATPTTGPDPSGLGATDQFITVTCNLPLITPLLPSPVTITARASSVIVQS